MGRHKNLPPGSTKGSPFKILILCLKETHFMTFAKREDQYLPDQRLLCLLIEI